MYFSWKQTSGIFKFCSVFFKPLSMVSTSACIFLPYRNIRLNLLFICKSNSFLLHMRGLWRIQINNCKFIIYTISNSLVDSVQHPWFANKHPHAFMVKSIYFNYCTNGLLHTCKYLIMLLSIEKNKCGQITLCRLSIHRWLENRSATSKHNFWSQIFPAQ